MHPSLAPHLHSECLEVIEQLHRCHEQVRGFYVSGVELVWFGDVVLIHFTYMCCITHYM